MKRASGVDQVGWDNRMVDVMGQTPEEFEQMLKDQIAAAEKKAKAIQELVERLTSARVSGMDANRDVEVEVNSDGRLTKISIDDNAMRGSAEELERSIMEAYAAAGRNRRPSSARTSRRTSRTRVVRSRHTPPPSSRC